MPLYIGEVGEVVGDTLIAVPLTPYWCAVLGPKVREADKVDCIAHDQDATQALLAGCGAGPAAAILDIKTRQPVGAVGWTFDGNIWSLWIDLTPEQSRELMRHTKSAVFFMATRAAEVGVLLSNVVWDQNRTTLAWLRASKCFDFPRGEMHHGGKTFLPFFVKPLEELIHV
jgi:hypothetical protein